MRYVEARLTRDNRDSVYRIYVTDALQGIPQQKFSNKRYIDLIQPVKVDTRTGDEIAAEVIKKLGLKVV